MAIVFHNADIKFTLPEKSRLKAFLKAQISPQPAHKQSISFVFCSDEYLLQINRRFLDHDYYTDIITFPLEKTEHYLEAEIYISIDRVRENAGKFGRIKSTAPKGVRIKPPAPTTVSQNLFELELRRVIFHGILHLLGYKDKTKAQRDEMRKMESVWLAKYLRFKA